MRLHHHNGGEHFRQSRLTNASRQPPRHVLLLAELLAALQANDPDTFKRWLYGVIQDLGEPAVTELLLDWIDPFIT